MGPYDDEPTLDDETGESRGRHAKQCKTTDASELPDDANSTQLSKGCSSRHGIKYAPEYEHVHAALPNGSALPLHGLPVSSSVC